MKYSLLLLPLLIVACASNPTNKEADQKAQTVSMESKQLANEAETSFVTELEFQKNKTGLTKTARNDLKALVNKARAKGKIDEVKVITWADSEYPSVYDKKLSYKQQDLVKKRNRNIENYLEKVSKGTDVESISMAERPNALAKLFATDEAKIKRSLETAGIPNTDTSVKVPGKASKSIVILIMKD